MVVSLPVAVQFLIGGRAVYSALKFQFWAKIPILVQALSICTIVVHFQIVKGLMSTALLLWDKLVINYRQKIGDRGSAIEECTWFEAPIWRNASLFIGEFRQTLPLVGSGNRFLFDISCFKI